MSDLAILFLGCVYGPLLFLIGRLTAKDTTAKSITCETTDFDPREL